MALMQDQAIAPTRDIDVDAVRQKMVPHGVLRVAINLGNPVLAQRSTETGELTGVSVVLAKALAAELCVPVKLTPFDAAGKVFAALEDDKWDLAFLAIEPVRAEKIAFSTPYVTIDGTYLMRRSSPYQSVAELDTEACRIAVGKGAAYDLFLSRTLLKAKLHRSPTSESAMHDFLALDLDAAAGVRQPLERFAESHPELQVLKDNFTEIRQAMAVPKARILAALYVERFIGRALRDGLVHKALAESGQPDARVTQLSPVNE